MYMFISIPKNDDLFKAKSTRGILDDDNGTEQQPRYGDQTPVIPKVYTPKVHSD